MRLLDQTKSLDIDVSEIVSDSLVLQELEFSFDEDISFQ